jgi:hypothetical protein
MTRFNLLWRATATISLLENAIAVVTAMRTL